MENKYYIPEMKDLHIGMDCEIYSQNTRKLIRKVGWHNVKVDHGCKMSEYIGILKCNHLIKTKHLRVKYLDRDDIESFGFINTEKGYDENELSYQSCESSADNFKYIILYSLINKGAWIYKLYNDDSEEDLFKGTIKNISEFKILLKQLNILKNETNNN